MRRNLGRIALGITEGTAPEEVAARDAALRRLLLMADVIAAGVALLVAVPLLGDDRLLLPAMLLLPLATVASRAMGLYDRDEIVLSKTTIHEGPSLFHLATLYALLVYVGQKLFVEGQLGPLQGLGLWGSFLVATFLCRALVRRLGVRHTPAERCLVLGDADRVARVGEKLSNGWALNAEIVTSIEPDRLPPGTASRRALADLVTQHRVHRVVVASGELDSDRLLSIVRDMKALGVKVSVRPQLLDVVGSAVEFEHIHGDVFLGVRRFGLSRAERRTKRVMDVIGSAFMLLAIAPVLATIALAIKVNSRGPVFFRQTRVGRDGERFRIWKFRTMEIDAEERKAALMHRNEVGEGMFKLSDDPRVTRVGRFLRGTSLDELPQLLNVMRGQMSLVGPRPLIVEEDQRIQGWHRRRLHLTPGMTGMWQVLGSGRLPMHEMVALDYLYIVNWSMWNDVQILLRTAAFVFRRRGV